MDQVGRYRILEELGRSGSALLYRATDPAIDKTVDLQSIPLTGGDTDEARAFRENLIAEAHSATILSHPNIVTIYDIFENGELAYISSESVDGVSLEQLLRTGTPPERRKFLAFLRQIAEALDYAHRKGIVHRDLKPANIVVAGRGAGAEQAVKIAGFGMAAFVSNKVLQNGSFAGMPNYMAPEQIQGLPVTGKADQFSFGVMIYEMLCGAKPFTAENLQGLLYSICKQNPKPVEQINPLLNETVNRVVLRALAKEPEERFSSCCDFVAALSFALDECPDWKPVASVAVATPPPVKPVEQPDGRDERIRAAAAVLAIGTGGELPGRERTARRIAAAQPSEENSRGKRVALVIALCFVVAAAVIFIVRRNSAPPPPLQVLDTKTGPTAPPPEDVKTAPKESPPVPTEDTASADQTLQPPPSTPSAAPAVTPSPNTAVPKAEASLESAELSRKPAKPSSETDAETQAAAAPAKTDVELVTDPPGGKVVVDSHQSCLSPCSMSLSSGRHTLTAELTGYTVAQKIIQVPDDVNVFLPLVRSVGVLLVSSEPSGSQVAVDGKNYGPTPVTLHLTAGAHHLTISDGDRRHDETIEIDGDGVHTRTFRW
ncbi:MAG TPA: serine/threonine-protein kinase [Bryobacteraceae bacterium]